MTDTLEELVRSVLQEFRHGCYEDYNNYQAALSRETTHAAGDVSRARDDQAVARIMTLIPDTPPEVREVVEAAKRTIAYAEAHGMGDWESFKRLKNALSKLPEGW
jgi:DNA-directed RNA polymerase subunit F